MIQNIGYAVRLFYEKVELSNDDIKNLFGVSSPATVKKMKDKVLAAMEERNIPRYSRYGVNTDVAFEVWGLDIKALERKHRQFQKLNLAEVTK